MIHPAGRCDRPDASVPHCGTKSLREPRSNRSRRVTGRPVADARSSPPVLYPIRLNNATGFSTSCMRLGFRATISGFPRTYKTFQKSQSSSSVASALPMTYDEPEPEKKSWFSSALGDRADRIAGFTSVTVAGNIASYPRFMSALFAL